MDIIQTLQASELETIPNLAARYGASERTILYDLNALTADHPIDIVRGRYGGVRLLASAYQRTLGDTEQEFLLSLLPGLSKQQSTEMCTLLRKHGSRRNKEHIEGGIE